MITVNDNRRVRVPAQGRPARVAVIGAGVAGLTAAADLARLGFEVMVFERGTAPGGKLRVVEVDGRVIDAGPTVFTLRDVFDQLYADAGETLESHLRLQPASLLARHAWSADEQLDLYADVERSAAAIGTLAGAAEARGFLQFTAQARRIYRTLEHTFMRASRPSPIGLVARVGWGHLAEMWNIQPFATLSQATARYFKDPRLQQLFGRYATYCGSSPFAAPGTLMLIAHVEQAGVWYVDGGMQRLAAELAALAARQGAAFHYRSEVRRIHVERGAVSGIELADGRRIAVDAVVSNADNNALAEGRLGVAATRAVAATPRRSRSLSAVTWNLLARTSGFELAHHSVFFGGDYRREFDEIFRQHRLPTAPTIYVCAQDRRDLTLARPGVTERLLCLINAPPIGDIHEFDPTEIAACETQVFDRLAQCGLHLLRQPETSRVTTPADFERLFPATGGALYGAASHGWMASFKRPGSRSRIPGLYLAGGSTHPGPGVPMAATSGRLAAACIAADRASISPSRTVATPGGTSMASAMTAPKD